MRRKLMAIFMAMSIVLIFTACANPFEASVSRGASNYEDASLGNTSVFYVGEIIKVTHRHSDGSPSLIWMDIEDATTDELIYIEVLESIIQLPYIGERCKLTIGRNKYYPKTWVVTDIVLLEPKD